MKTIFYFFEAVLIGVLAMPLTPRAAGADTALPARRGGQPPLGSKSGSAFNASAPQRAPAGKADLAQFSSFRQQPRNESYLAGSSPASDGISPPFRVSRDPRDQVQLLVSNRVVTILGSVGSEELARKLAQKYARLPGVHEVRNLVTVRTNPDAAIAAKVREALSRDPDTHIGGVGVTVVNGMVFLSGSVSSLEESNRADELARALPGVTRVSNGLRVSTATRYTARSTPRTRYIPRR